MTTVEHILERKNSGKPFVIHLSDGRSFNVKGSDWISTNPSGKGSSITIYGPGEEEEHWIPVFAITTSCGQDQ